MERPREWDSAVLTPNGANRKGEGRAQNQPSSAEKRNLPGGKAFFIGLLSPKHKNGGEWSKEFLRARG